MLAVMSSDQARDISKDFLTTGRTGRRNALPDILGENARTSVADLPDQLGALSTSDGKSGLLMNSDLY
jgi:cAMP-dependent protein kinase inhibitor.